MSTQQDAFIKQVLPYAKKAADDTDVPVSVVLAHWGHETGWGTSRAWTVDHNPAGLMSGGHPIHFADLPAGVASYIRTLLNPRYSAVRAAKSPEDTIVALGRSQYDADNYGGDGRLVLNTWKTADVAKYDTSDKSFWDKVTGFVGSSPVGGLAGGPSLSDVAGGAKDVAEGAATAVTSTADAIGWLNGQGPRRVVIGGVLVAGGVALVVTGAWRGFVPDEVRERATGAAKKAARGDVHGAAATVAPKTAAMTDSAGGGMP